MTDFKKHQYRRILTDDGTLADGDYIVDDDNGVRYLIRCTDGFLNDCIDENGELLPAVESENGNHIEHWQKGVLHCEKEPALIDVIENIEEWYINGKPRED